MTMDAITLLQRVAELAFQYSLEGLDTAAASEAEALIAPMMDLLDRDNLAQGRAYDSAMGAADLPTLDDRLAPLWNLFTLLSDTDEIVWLELSLWMVEAQPAATAVNAGDRAIAPLLGKLCEQAVELLPRVVNRFAPALPAVTDAYREGRLRRRSDSFRLLLGAHSNLAAKMANQ